MSTESQVEFVRQRQFDAEYIQSISEGVNYLADDVMVVPVCDDSHWSMAYADGLAAREGGELHDGNPPRTPV